MDNEEHFKNGKYLTSKAKELLLFAAIVFGFLFLLTDGHPQQMIGWQKIPASFFEKQHYSAKLYVLAYEKEASTKSIKLVANVERGTECPDDIDEDCSSRLYYRLDSVNVPDNGGTTDFDQCFLVLNKRVQCTTNDDETLFFQLTNETVK